MYYEKEINGIRLKIPSELPDYCYRAGHFCLQRAAQNAFCYIDIGANVGYYVVVASKSMNVNGTIFAFEAIKENVNILKENVSNNSVSQNVVIENKAVSHSSEPLLLYITNNPTKHTALKHKSKTFAKSKRKVESVVLDEYINQKVDFIKMDVEGWECHCVESAKRIIKNDKPHLMMEFTPKRINRVKSVKWLRKFLMNNYEIFYEIDDRDNKIIRIDPNLLTDDYFKNRNRSNSDIFCTNSITDLEESFSEI